MNVQILGIICGLAGVMLLTAMDSTAKALGANLPVFQVVFVRYLGAAIWLALYVLVTGRDWPQRRNTKRYILRGALLTLTACFFFYSVTHLPLAIASALAMSAPIYVSLLGIFVLKERFVPTLGLAIALGITGSLIVVFGGDPIQPTGPSSLLAWGAAIMAPLTYACTLVLLKHHATDEGAAAMTLAQSLVAAIIMLPFAATDFVMPSPLAWGQIVVVGFLGAFSFLLIIAGLRRLPASIFAVVDYTALIWAAIFGFVFFAEAPPLQLWIGGALIIAACALGARSTRTVSVNPSSI